MLFATFIFRHITRHWGMNLAVLFALTIGSALLGSLPSFAAATATRSLDATLENAHPSIRNIQLVARPEILTMALHGYVNESLGSLFQERISVGSLRIAAHSSSPMIKNQEIISAQINDISIWSFDKLTQHTMLQIGDWPVATYPQSQSEALKPPTIQAVITEDVARELQLQIGDQLQDINEFKYQITGIISVDDPEEDVWWQDKSPFIVSKEPGLNEDTIIAPVIINPQSMKEYLPVRRSEWRYILNTNVINVNNVEQIESDLINLKNRITASHAKITTGLPNLILEYRQNLSTSRMVLYLLSSQAFLFVLFTLTLMASLLVNNSKSELVTMTSRGASRFQIVITLAIQTLILALIAGLILGPLLTLLGLTFWSWFSGDSITNQLPLETWRMSMLAVGIGWTAIVLAIIPATRSSLLEWQQSITRPAEATFWQKSYLDIFLLIIGALLFWQLSNSGSFVLKRLQGTSYADPLILIGPSLLLIALAMVYLRLFPLLLRSLTGIVNSSRGIVLPLGITRIARNPQRMSWIILLISLAAALTLFARIYAAALNDTQTQIAKYQAGSDLRLDLNNISRVDFIELSKGLSKSFVLRGRAQGRTGRVITILAVDPDSLATVSQYPEGMINLTMEIIMQALKEPVQTNLNDSMNSAGNPYTEQRDSTEPIPAIFSYSALRRDGKIGDHQDFIIAGQPLTFKVHGIIADFPTLTSYFIIVNKGTFEKIAGPSITTQLTIHEAWVSTENLIHNQLVSNPVLANAILADSQKILSLIRNNILTLGTVRAFGLNAFVLAILSLAGIVLANYFSFRQRAYEFGILRAFGLSQRQSNQLIIGESALILGLGLLSGLLLGFGLTRFMHPYISLAVSRTLPGMIVHQISVNWEVVATVTALLILLYGAATTVIIYALWKTEVHQILRTGDE